MGSKFHGSLTFEWHMVPRTHPFFLTRSHSWSVSGYKAWQISGLGDTRCKYLSHTTTTCFNCAWVQRWIIILCFFIHKKTKIRTPRKLRHLRNVIVYWHLFILTVLYFLFLMLVRSGNPASWVACIGESCFLAAYFIFGNIEVTWF